MQKYQKTIINKKLIFILFLLITSIMGLFSYYFSMNGVMPQSAIYFLNDIELPKSGQNVLIFSPHPDDETIGAGGYIINSIKKGANVRIVLVTDGNKHGLKDRRYEEFKKSTSLLGVDENNLIFLNYQDGKLDQVDQEKLTSLFQKKITDFNPKFIIYPNPLDKHKDHSITGNIVKKILEGKKEIVSYQYLVHYHDYPKPKMYRDNLYLLPPINAVRFNDEWVKLLLSPEIENQKYRAILSYKTQLKVPILKSLIMSSIRKNELFSKEGTK